MMTGQGSGQGRSSLQLQSVALLPCGEPVAQELLLKVGQHPHCTGHHVSAVRQAAQSPGAPLRQLWELAPS